MRSTWRDARTLFVLLLALGLFVAACAPADEATEPAEVDVDDEEPVVDEPEPEGEPADTITLRYTTNAPELSMVEAPTRYILAHLEERTGGQLEIEPFWAASLVPQGEDLTAVQTGTVDVGHIVQAIYAEQFPLWGISGLPFLVEEPDTQLRAMQALYDNNEAVRAEFEQLGVRPFYWKPLGPTAMGLPRTVERIEDLEGLRVRAIGVYVVRALQAVGIDPVEVDFTETYEAVERGTVDGWGAVAFDLAVDVSLHEVSPIIFNPRLGTYLAVTNVISIDAWEALPENLRAEFEQLTEEAYDAAIAEMNEKEAAACEAVQETGNEVVVLSDAELERWRELTLDDLLEVWRDIARQAGHDDATIDEVETQYLELVEQFGAESEFVSGMELCA